MVSLSGLKPSQYRKYMRAWDRDRYKSLFQQFTNDPRAYRIYLPVDTDAATEVSATPPSVVSGYLSNLGYEVTDYRAGIAQKEGRAIRIGKVLKDPEVKKQFDNDPQRQATKTAKTRLLVVISRHPYDIAGMSTHRGWTSCMDIDVGENKSFVLQDVKVGTLVAYLIHDDDLNINKPVARMLIKPFKELGGKDVKLVPEGVVYGQGVPQFARTVEAWTDQVNGELATLKWYKLAKKLYADGPEGRLLGTINESTLKKIVAAACIDGADYFSVEVKKQLPKFAQYMADNAEALGLDFNSVSELINRGAFQFFTPEQAAIVPEFPAALAYKLSGLSSPSSIARAMYCLTNRLMNPLHMSPMSLGLTLAVSKNKKLCALKYIRAKMSYCLPSQSNEEAHAKPIDTLVAEELLEISRVSGKVIPLGILTETRRRFSTEDLLKLFYASSISVSEAAFKFPSLLKFPEFQDSLLKNPPAERIAVRARGLRALLQLPMRIFEVAKFRLVYSGVSQNVLALESLTPKEIYELRVVRHIEGFAYEQYDKLATLVTGDAFYKAVYEDAVSGDCKLSTKSVALAGPIDSPLRLSIVLRDLQDALYREDTGDRLGLELLALSAIDQGVRVENKFAGLSRLAVVQLAENTEANPKRTYVSFLQARQRARYYTGMKTSKA